MNQETVIGETARHVRSKLEGEGTGHDWWHVHRVWQNALSIGREEKADLFVVELGALLHDIADWKFHGGDDKAGSRAAREWLERFEVGAEVVDDVCRIIDGVSFKGAGVNTPMNSIEGKVVQDADRLDALGAIGIARAFAYGGHAGSELYNPDVPVMLHETFDDYKAAKGTTVNHFHEKLLLLKDRMLTTTGRQMAESRHEFMKQYLDRFMMEWSGKA